MGCPVLAVEYEYDAYGNLLSAGFTQRFAEGATPVGKSGNIGYTTGKIIGQIWGAL